MKLNIHAGHNYHVKGAVGLIDETVEARKVKDLVVDGLRKLGHTVFDCTDENGLTQSQNLKNIVTKCNANDVDLDISIHFNAYNTEANGVEVYIYSDNSKAKSYASDVVNNIANLGFKNRGVKTNASLYVLKHTKAPSMLIECCFCDNAKDVANYNAVSVANAIINGLVEVKQEIKEEVRPKPQPTQPKVDSWVEKVQAECKKQGLKLYPTVKKGAKGNITRLIQERLNSVGFNLKTDGIFGNTTFNAIKVFQKNRGLAQDGIVGSRTWDWLIKGTKM